MERDWLEGKLSSLDLSVKRAFIGRSKDIQAKNQKPSLNLQLELFKISKTVYYYELKAQFSINEDKRLLDGIDEIHTDYPYYFTKRMVLELKKKGFKIGRKLVKKAFEYLGIVLYTKPKTTIVNRLDYKYPYLFDEYKYDNGLVKIDKPNVVWNGDITYIKLEKGFAYLCAIIDWDTKKIFSWKLSNTIDLHLTTSVIKDAMSKYAEPKIFNSDQGTRPNEATTLQEGGQYTLKEHIQILTDNNILIFMDGKGRSIDNITIERLWRRLKYENLYPKIYKTLKEARDDINEYISIYNSKRICSTTYYNTLDEVYDYWKYSCNNIIEELLQTLE